MNCTCGHVQDEHAASPSNGTAGREAKEATDIAEAMAEARATLVMAFLELIDQHIQRAEDATAQDAAHLTGLAAALLLRRLRQEVAALLPAGARGAKPRRRT